MKDERKIMQDAIAKAVFFKEATPSQFDAISEKPLKRLKPVSIVDAISNPSPAPQFAWEGYLPFGTVSLLSAHGGHGKSTVGLMLSVRVSTGSMLFGVGTTGCKTLLVSLEDSKDVVRHRLAKICKAWKIDPRDLDDRMMIVDGTDFPELYFAESRGEGNTTATYDELKKLIATEKFGLVIIDNASNAFAGDEIQRRQVQSFGNSLIQIATHTTSAILVLAHIDKVSSRSRGADGESYSGSTAWHNVVRSRLFMTRKNDGTLLLEHHKSNFGRMQDPIVLEWPDDGLPQLIHASDIPVDDNSAQMRRRADDNRAIAILKLIHEYASRQQFCSPATTSRNSVFALLKSDPSFQRLKLTPDDVKRTVTQCQRANWLEIVGYRDGNRKPHQRWTLTASGCSVAALPAPTVLGSPSTVVGAPCSMEGERGAPTAPSSPGGVGDGAHTEDGANATPV